MKFAGNCSEYCKGLLTCLTSPVNPFNFVKIWKIFLYLTCSVPDTDQNPGVFCLPDPDPDPLVRGKDPDPDPDPSIIMQKY